MKILITGGTGFVGSHFIDKLLDNGHKPICMIRKSSNTRWLEKHKEIEYINCDLQHLDEKGIEKLAEDINEIDAVIHCAAAVKALNYTEYYKSNVVTTINLLKASKKINNKNLKFIFISSQAACGPSDSINGKTEDDIDHKPLTSYGKTKLIAEQETLKFKDDFKVTILSPSSIYGPREKEFKIIFSNAKKGFFTTMGGMDLYADMLYVSDFVDIMYTTLRKDDIKSGEKFFISDGDKYSRHSIKACLDKTIGKKTFLINVPKIGGKILGYMLSFFSFISKKPIFLNKEKVREILAKYQVFSIEKAKKMLDYKPQIKLKKGFQLTYDWYKENNWL